MLLLLAFSVSVWAEVVIWNGQAAIINQYQLDNIRKVRQIAIANPDRQGRTWPDTAAAIYLNEASQYLSADVGKIGDLIDGRPLEEASFGLGQVQLDTAKDIFRHHNMRTHLGLSDKHIINLLLHDDFSLLLLVLNINRLMNITNNHFRTVSRYNGGNHNHKYYRDYQENLRVIRQLQEKGAI